MRVALVEPVDLDLDDVHSSSPGGEATACNFRFRHSRNRVRHGAEEAWVT